MCLEQFPFYYGIFMMMVVVVQAQRQMNQSPCPRTFQYETDQNGQVYGGTIGVYSFDENVIQLDVKFSVGNPVNNNGAIELVTPRDQVLSTIQNQRPLRYRVYFPRWENESPKITMISVNGQVVCTGPPVQLSDWVHIVTTISLQHKFMIQYKQLGSQNSYNPNQNTIGNTGFPGRDQVTGSKPSGNPFFQGGNGGNDGGKGNQNPFQIKEEDFDIRRNENEFLGALFTTTTARTTTERRYEKPVIPPNDLLFTDNPYLNGEVSFPSSSNTPRTPPRGSPRPAPKPTPSRSVSNNDCGVPVVANPLIINGNSVPRGAFPWLTAIFASTGFGVVEYKCSGTLVSKKHIVTAAHCVQKNRKQIAPDKLLFILGKLNVENLLIGDGEKMVGAEEIKVHPDYVPLTSDADIAVVILSQAIEFTKYIRPICIWSESDDLDTIVGQKGKVVGWGRDEHNNSMTPEPKQTTMPVVSQEECLRSSEIFKYVTSARTFCAGERNDSGPCNGDSGTGFVMKRNNRWFLKGIVSISTWDSNKQSCDLSNYVVFTDVSKFKDWLLSIIVI